MLCYYIITRRGVIYNDCKQRRFLYNRRCAFCGKEYDFDILFFCLWVCQFLLDFHEVNVVFNCLLRRLNDCFIAMYYFIMNFIKMLENTNVLGGNGGSGCAVKRCTHWLRLENEVAVKSPKK